MGVGSHRSRMPHRSGLGRAGRPARPGRVGNWGALIARGFCFPVVRCGSGPKPCLHRAEPVIPAESSHASEGKKMNEPEHPITVFYDGACPRCVRDRAQYERWAGPAGEWICWFDITGQDEQLRALGIDPHRALTELHVLDEHQRLRSELAERAVVPRRPRPRDPGREQSRPRGSERRRQVDPCGPAPAVPGVPGGRGPDRRPRHPASTAPTTSARCSASFLAAGAPLQRHRPRQPRRRGR